MKKYYFLLLALSFFAFGFSQTTIVTIDRENGVGPTATDNVTGVSASGFTRGAGLAQANASNSNFFSSRNFTINGDLGAAQTNEDYIEWSVSANTLFEVSIEEFDIRVRRNANGPSNFQIIYSLDGFTSEAGSVSEEILAPNSTNNFDFSIPSIDLGPSGTITFRLYAWGAATNNGNFRILGNAAWAGDLNIANPGARILGTIVAPTTESFESDIVSTTFSGVPQTNIDYTQYSALSDLNFVNSVPVGVFSIRDGGELGTDGDTDPTILNTIEFAITNSENIAAIAIFDGFSKISETSSVAPLTELTGFNLTANDNGTKEFLVFATFKSVVTDNAQIELTINKALTPSVGSSLFSESNAGGAQTSTTGDDNRIEVTVSQFQFDQQPTDGNEMELLVPFPTIIAVDANLNQDVDANISGISINTLQPSSIVPSSYDIINGEAVLNNIMFLSTETAINLTASAPALSGTSDSFNINGPLIALAQQDFDSQTGWTYTSDTPFRTTTTDPIGVWGGAEGYFGEINLTNTSPISNALFSENIFGENDLNDTANPRATITFEDITVTGINNLVIEFDWEVVGYTTNANDVQYRLVLNGSTASGWQDVFDGNGPIDDAQGREKISIADGFDTVGLQLRLRNNRTDGYSGFDNFRLVSQFSGLIYTAATGWRDNILPNSDTADQDALIIDGTYNVENNAKLDNLVVNADASVFIDFGKSLEVNNLFNFGGVELTSLSNNYSSLIVNETIRNGVTYDRHVNSFADTGSSTGKNDLISAPVTNANQTFEALQLANPGAIPSGTIGGIPSFLFGPFDNVTNQFINYTSADNSSIISPGTGYRTASTDPSGSNFRFEGDVEIGAITVPTNVGTASVFNLIGNPYPSYIRLDTFLAENNDQFNTSSSGVYGYIGNLTTGYSIWNQAYSDANPEALIAPGQGFLVSANTGGGLISFNPNMRSNGTSDDFILGRFSNNPNLANLTLQITSGDLSAKTDIYFNDNASLAMDSGYDSGMFNAVTPDFAIYSHLVENNIGLDLAAQSVGFTSLDNVVIPLGINASQGEQITVSLGSSTLPEDTVVLLEDNMYNTFTNLTTSDYIFTPSTTLTDTGRFYLHMTPETLSTSESILNGLEIYTSRSTKELIIRGLLDNDTNVVLLDIQGRMISTVALNRNDSEQRIDVSGLASGIYVVQISANSNTRTQKIIID
jgi:hypothetical protein